MASDAYSRLYHRFAKQYPDVYGDDHGLATWVRLLMLADASWPLIQPVPRSVKPAALRKLTEAEEVVDGVRVLSPLIVVDGDHYTVRGLDAERIRRRDAGRTGAAVRWHSDGNATADATAMPRRDETRRDEIPPPPAERGRRNDGTNLRSVGQSPRQAGTNPRQVEARDRREAPLRVAEILRRANALGAKA